MNEGTRDTARTAIEVFVAAPACEISVPIVEFQFQITSGMRQVEASDRTNGMRGFGDRFHVERLTGVEVDPTETDEGQFIAEFVDLRKDVLCSEQMFPYTWLHFNEIDIRVSTVEGDL